MPAFYANTVLSLGIAALLRKREFWREHAPWQHWVGLGVCVADALVVAFLMLA